MNRLGGLQSQGNEGEHTGTEPDWFCHIMRNSQSLAEQFVGLVKYLRTGASVGSELSLEGVALRFVHQVVEYSKHWSTTFSVEATL